MNRVPATFAVLVSLMFVALACDDSDPEPANLPQPRDILEVTSPDIEDGGEFPTEFTCDGANISPAIRWTQASNTEEYLLLMTDPDAPSGTFVHWKLLGIDPQRSSVGQNEPPSEAVLGINSFGDTGYSGPCPPEGRQAHTYEITVYALNRDLELAADVDLRELLDQIECCLEASGTLEASHGR
jgi:Raf kinase inhibitor-like YbhB/YbcL family protein